MNTEKFISHSAQQTTRIARQWACEIPVGSLIALQGDLGSGKTCFAKGAIAQWTDVLIDQITSPSFTIIEEYQNSAGIIYHVDLYRLENVEEIANLPWDELLAPTAITLVEWPERTRFLLDKSHWLIKFEKPLAEQRIIEIYHQG